jgi:hypothetical protein
MSELSLLLDRMRVRASVHGGAVTAELHDHDEVDISFAPDYYGRVSVATMEQHLTSLGRLLRTEYFRQYYAAVSEAFRQTVTREVPAIGRQDREYVSLRRDLVAEGRSSDGRITVTVRGMEHWDVRIADGTAYEITEAEFIGGLREAAGALIRHQFAGIRELKNRVYG